MKLLLALILILAFTGSFINSMPIKDSNCVGVISSLNGYNTKFKAVSFNGVFQNGDQTSQASFYESGYISLDFKNQEMMVQFQINLDNQQPIIGQTFIYAQNHTQYVLANGECTQIPFSGSFPSSIGLVQVGESSIGSVDVEVLEPQTQTPSANQQLLVDSKLCSPVSLEVTNSPNETPGFTLLNFYNYEPNVVQSDFVLPSQCQSNQVEKIHSTQLLKLYPKFIKNLL